MADKRLLMGVALTAFVSLSLAATIRPKSSILFPSPAETNTSSRIGGVSEPPSNQLVFTEIPACATNSEYGLCESGEFPYPADVVKNAIATSFNAVAGLASGDDKLVNDIGNRFGSTSFDDAQLLDETTACRATEAIIRPVVGVNDKNLWKVIVNNEEVVQGIRVEKCAKEGEQCRMGLEGTVCRQKYIYRKMLSVNGQGLMDTDNFRIPSCCVCHIKSDFLILRFNADRTKLTTETPSTERPLKRRRRVRRQSARQPEIAVQGGEAAGVSGSPLDRGAAVGAGRQGTAQQSVETEASLAASDTLGGDPVRFAGEIVVHSNPIVVQKRPKQRRN